MKVKFDFTLDDLVDAAERGTGHSKLVRAWRWREMVVTAVLGGVIMYVLRSGSHDTKLVWAVIGAIIAAAIYSFSAGGRAKGGCASSFGSASAERGLIPSRSS